MNNSTKPYPKPLKLIAAASALTVLGYLGNYLNIPLSFGVNFIFGSIFSIIAAVVLGLWWGVGVSVVSSFCTYQLWNHPYAMIILTAEVLWLGLFLKRGRKNLLLLDSLYWLLCGAPLVMVFYFWTMKVDAQGTALIMFKQSLNGIVNTLAASILVSHTPLSRWRAAEEEAPLPSYAAIIFHAIAAFLIIPTLGLLFYMNHRTVSAEHRRLEQNLEAEAREASEIVRSWINGYINAARVIGDLGARYPLKPSARLQEELMQIHALSPDFHNVFLGDAQGRTVAFDPPVNERGESTIGISFGDREWFLQLRNTLQPVVSEVFMGRGGVFKPIFSISVPVVQEGRLVGFGLGAVNLEKLQEHISVFSKRTDFIYAIVDNNDRIIVSTDRARLPLSKSSTMKGGTTTAMAPDIFLWVPGADRNSSSMKVWKGATYFTSLPIEGTTWTLRIECPLEPLQRFLYSTTIWGFGGVTVLYIFAILFAHVISRYLSVTPALLSVISKDLPARIDKHELISWPHANTYEMSQLVGNFRATEEALRATIDSVRRANLELDQNVQARTVQLQASQAALNEAQSIAHVGSWQAAFHGEDIIEWSGSDELHTIFGYPRDMQLTLQTGIDRIHPEDKARALAAWKAAVKGEGPCMWEYRILVDDRIKWIQTRVRFEFDSAGAPTAANGILQDITERRAAEDKLLDLAREQQIILDTAPVGISRVIDRIQVWVNRKNEEMFQYSKAELEGQTTRKLYPTQEAFDQFGRDAYPAVFQGGIYETEQLLLRRDGTPIWVRYSGRAVEPADRSKGTIWLLEDVTEPKRLREELLSQSLKNELLLRTASDGIHILDMKGNLIQCNDAFCRMLGYTPGELRGKNVSAWDVQWSDQELREKVALLIKQPAVFETRHRRCDNRIIDVEINAVGVEIEGKPMLFASARDISERKQTEKALRESEGRFRALADSAPALIWMSGTDKLCNYFNKGWLNFTGRTMEQEMGNGWAEGVHPEDMDRCLQIYVEAFDARRPFEMEYRLRRFDGQYRWIVDAAIPRFEGEAFAGYIGACMDIQDRREIQDHLTRVMQEQHTILENAVIGITLVRDRKFVWVNKTLCQMLVHAPEGLEGQSTRLIYPSEAAYERAGEAASLSLAKGEVVNMELELIRSDGTLLWTSMTGTAVNFADMSAGSIWLIEDISKRRRAEGQLKQRTLELESLTANLEKKVEEELSIRRKNEDMLIQQSKMAAMGEMLGAISHQWRQPLNILGLVVQNIGVSYDYGELDRAYLEKAIGKSMTQIKHMSKTIDDFRNFFRPDKEKVVFDTMAAVAEVLKLMSAQLEANMIDCRLICHTLGKTFQDFTATFCCAVNTVSGYQNEFEHVVLNLINNAKDAIAELRTKGGLSPTDRGNIDFDFYLIDDMVSVEISDNGGGIEPSILSRIFEPYFTTKDQTKGTGLGLYMSKVIMEQMDGSIAVRNSGQGAVFTIKMPGVKQHG